MEPLKAAALAALIAVGACYSPSVQECSVSCGTGGSCPSDTTCMSDGYCHADIAVTCQPLNGDGGGNLPDARKFDAPMGPPDGRPMPDGRMEPDARMPDARVPDAAGPPDSGVPCTNQIQAIEETDFEDSIISNLSVSPTGIVHVTYLDFNSGTIRYARRAPGEFEWTFDDLAQGAGYLKGQALDANGVLHVAYTDQGIVASRLRYAHGTLFDWLTETIDSTALGIDATIAVDPSATRIHVGYWYNLSDLRYATRSTTEDLWKIVPVDQEGIVGEHPSIGLGPQGSVHISYRIAGTRNDLGYAVLRNATSNFNLSRPDQTGNVGEYTALAVDGTGAAHIAYSDITNEQLKYAYVPGSGPTEMFPVEPGVGVGRFNSLALDRQGGVHISYYAYGDRNLRYAVKKPNTSAFTARTLDSVGDVGRHSSIGVDAFGIAHISYIDDSNGDVKYARVCP